MGSPEIEEFGAHSLGFWVRASGMKKVGNCFGRQTFACSVSLGYQHTKFFMQGFPTVAAKPET